MKKRKGLVIAITVIGGLICVMAMLVVFLLYQYTNSYEYHLKLAQKYLMEEAYEQAIAEYEIAIAIDPTQKDAYEELAEIYVELEEYEEAMEILEEGYEETEAKGLNRKIEKIKEKYLAMEQEETDVAVETQAIQKVLEEPEVEYDVEEIAGDDDDNKSEQDLYAGFLNGDVPLYFHDNGYVYYDEELFDANRGYTLVEIVEELREYFSAYEESMAVKSVAYSYLDCGKDGIKELAIQFNGMNIYSPDDDSTVVYIIKEINEKLELCYAYETWARSYSGINEYGFYESSGSNGASNYGQSKGYIDGNGKWNFIKYTEQEGDINQLTWSHMFGAIPQVADTKVYEGTIIFYTTIFEEITVDNYDSLERYCAFGVINAGLTQEEAYNTSVYREIFDEAGVKIYTPDEISQMVYEKEKKLGITDEIKHGNELTWTTILQ